ncbi:competence-damaged protein [Leptolyngbya boryana NIES-2135]|jgi:nicotinamide-nucleotide amidase|uniref:CinA-like protein n=1 Tax=Leptolyngbya boryana NIES-2135 TaxID=1973484 RepID=A0A1Z4JIK5_LEPBY|nr:MULTISPECIES: competence/damage-inducible protein A [Leptolyngbya]BAY56546.1 competence-damaged protein [Leptolyngbya boryana NIES-2135]MBD2369851.1 competence/damage-inducible protein A [Leptolyngbya sp. FACHB-161]MBD2376204.1 competence/damage-inducible protein A [Leptolyngbya sp. FACHB-238]MBD2400479.1 competence/damage-inducible protein A [Leptolyngbya sp. FACHB-239]MBD2407021.1 competence/damage-inducible protein A [Leptolyngbya sp. FACHB-402]
MNAEIISVGTEILLGDILNSNAQFLAQQFAELGIPHYFQTVVGDNPERLKRAIAIASDRANLIVFTGGLGPTPDDLTTETIADFFQTPLVEKPEIIEDIQQKFAQRGRMMTDNNRKQALIPEGANILCNAIGSAPGMIWQPRANLTILTFPGVPTEMKYMWREVAVPYLKSQGWGKDIIVSRTLRFWGISESALAEKVAPFFDLQNPTVAPYANYGEVKLRISAKAASAEAAQALITPIEQQLSEIAGIDQYGADQDTLASVVGDLLKSRHETLSVAESCTGGGLGQMLTRVSGSSAYFWGGIISYDNSVKEKMLGVDPSAIAEQGAVSAIVAEQMAMGVRTQLNTTWGVSITGVAGPEGGTDAKPVGLVYIGLANAEGATSQPYRFGDRGREWVRQVSACSALDQLRRRLLNKS